MTTKNAIEAAKITKKLKNFTLDVENFAIPQGFATALIGENGAGKTTLLNILAGIRLDYKGDITYFGQYSDKQKENSGDVKNRIGYTGPGKYYLPQWTVKDIEEISKLMFEDFSADDFHRYCEELAIFSHGSIDMKKANNSFSDGMKMKLMLAGGNFVVLGLGGDAQLPQLFVQFLHKSGDLGADDAEVVLFQLLTLGRRCAEESAAGEDEVLTGLVVFLLDKEVLLLGADGGGDVINILAEQLQDADGLTGQCVHGAQQGGLFVQCLAGVADESSGDAQHVILHESVAGGVPCGVAAGLAGGTQAAGGEGGSIGLAAHQLLTGELHDGGAVAHGAHKAVVLLTGDAGQRLEPVGVVGGTQLHGPALHHAGHNVCHLDIQRCALVQGALQALVSSARQALLHYMFVKDLAAVDFHNICCHKSYSLLDLMSVPSETVSRRRTAARKQRKAF